MQRPNIVELVKQFVTLPAETEWLEFKTNNSDHKEIGELISALSNSAALHGKECAFIVWGVDDSTHEIVGTTFSPREKKIGGSELENWLTTQLQPQTHFLIYDLDIDGKRVVVFEIERAIYSPVAFLGERWIRVGSYKKSLRAHPEKERALWKAFGRESFEDAVSMYGVAAEDLSSFISHRDFFVLAGKNPPHLTEVLPKLQRDKVIQAEAGGRFSITNLGALLFAKDIRQFESVRRKAPRLIFYKDSTRTKPFMEKVGRYGYASGFRGLVGFLISQLPHSEEIQKAMRVELPMYPEIALRELIGNALVHQDFEITGAGPMIEVFPDRIEITNPGVSLNDVQRLLDLPPRSRNERLAQLMKRVRICEERGTGIDKVVTSVELFQLPAPDFQSAGDNTRATLLGKRSFSRMTKADRIRACYQHASLLWVSNKIMTNETLRARFGFEDENKAQASRIIKDTVVVGLIRPYDQTSGSKRHAKYVPFWAA